MRRLSEWQFLVQSRRAKEVWTASCMFGSPTRKSSSSYPPVCQEMDYIVLARKTAVYSSCRCLHEALSYLHR